MPKISGMLSTLDLRLSAKFGLDQLRFARFIPERLIFWTSKVFTI